MPDRRHQNSRQPCAQPLALLQRVWTLLASAGRGCRSQKSRRRSKLSGTSDGRIEGGHRRKEPSHRLQLFSITFHPARINDSSCFRKFRKGYSQRSAIETPTLKLELERKSWMTRESHIYPPDSPNPFEMDMERNSWIHG